MHSGTSIGTESAVTVNAGPAAGFDLPLFPPVDAAIQVRGRRFRYLGNGRSAVPLEDRRGIVYTS